MARLNVVGVEDANDDSWGVDSCGCTMSVLFLLLNDQESCKRHELDLEKLIGTCDTKLKKIPEFI